MSIRSHIKQRVRALLVSQTGIAAVEFALITPFMLLAFLGATDVTQAVAVDRKLGQVASTVSDLVAQESEITRAEVQAFFKSGIAIMRPFDFDRTKLRLTIVEVDSSSTQVTGATELNWEVDASNGEEYPLDDEMVDLSEGRYIVVASASYQFAPLFGMAFDTALDLEQRSIHMVRQDVENFGFPMHEDDEGGLIDEIVDEVEDVVDDVADGGGGGSGGDDENDGDDEDRDDDRDEDRDDDDNDGRGNGNGGGRNGNGGGLLCRWFGICW